MSEHAHAAADSHGDHHYVYDGTPANEPGPDEPATPGWLTLLGITLVLAAMLGYLATRPDGKTRAELAPSAGSAAPAAAAPSPAQPARPAPSGFRPGMLPSAFLPRPGASAPHPLAPGQFAIQPGNPGGGVQAVRRPPPPSQQ
jgi:hypothetical protein